MYLNVSIVLVSTLLTSRFLHCQDVKLRRRRFASVLTMLEHWVGREGQEFAQPEKLVKNKVVKAPYDKKDMFEYLGRPKGFLANFLHWDEKYESMGPTLTRMVGLAKDLLEHTDIIQSLVAKNLVAKRKVYDSQTEKGNYIESNI